METLSKKKSTFLWVGLAIITLVFLLAIAFNAHPALRGPDAWRWTYAIPGVPGRYVLPGVVLFVYTAVAFFLARSLMANGRPSRRRQVGYLIFCALAVPILQLVLLSAESPDVIEQLFFRTVSPGSSGFFSVGSIIDDSFLFLRQYPELMPTFPVHPQRYPPGIPLLFYLVRTPLSLGGLGESAGAFLRPYQCMDLTLMRIPDEILGTAVLQMLLPFFSAFLIFPLFGLARRTLDWGTAVWSVALFPLVPSFALWAGRWDQFFPFLTVTAWYLLVVGLTDNKKWALFAAGLTLGLASTLSFGLLIMLLPMGFWALLWWLAHREEYTWQRAVVEGLIFLAGLGLFWIVLQGIFGTGVYDIWRVSMGFHLGLARSYWTWLGYHLYDFGLFLGIPLALLSLFAFFYALLTVRRELVALPIAFGLGVLLLNLSGTARGEVARVWIFLTPFAVLCAVWGMSKLTKRPRNYALVLGLLAVQLLLFTAFLRVVNTGLESVPDRMVVWERPFITNPLNVQVGESISLLGYDLEVEEAATLEVTLFWQPTTRLATPFTVFNHLVNSEGELVTQQDGMPVNNTVPTTCWLPGEIIADTHTLVLSAGQLPGDFILLSGIYNAFTGERLSISNGNISAEDAIILDTISINRD